MYAIDNFPGSPCVVNYVPYTISLIENCEADLSLTKTVSNSLVQNGENIIYTITVTNDGPSDATGVQVQDDLPGQVAYNGDDGNGDFNPFTGVWNVGDVANGESKTLEIYAIVNSSTANNPVINYAEIIAMDQDDADSSPDPTGDPLNNTDEDDEASAEFEIPWIDLEVEKTGTITTAHPGDFVTYTIELCNNSPYTATGVVVEDHAPPGLVYVGSEGFGAYVETEWIIGQVPAGQCFSIMLTFEVVLQEGIIQNISQVVAADQDDVDSIPNNDEPEEDDQDDHIIVVEPLIDLEISKQINNMMPETGETIIYTIDLWNNGPSNATGIEVIDALPSLVNLIGTSGDGFYSSITNTWSVASLPVGEMVSLELEVVVLADADDGQIVNWAEISAADQEDSDSSPDPTGNPENNDPVTEDDEDEAVFVVPMPDEIDLELIKSVNESLVATGDEVVYTITVNNNGPANATGVQVSDVLPEGLAYVSDNALGNYNPLNGIWTIASVPVGTSTSLQITATVQAEPGSGPIVNWAEITGADQEDVDSAPDPTGDPLNNTDEDDEDSVEIEILYIDLEVEKTGTITTAHPGDFVTYTIELCNVSPYTATGVVVEDHAPPGLEYVNTFGFGDYVETEWIIGTVPPGQCYSIMIMFKVILTEGIIQNISQVVAADQDDIDSVPNNDDPLEDDQDDHIIVVEPIIDLELNKQVSNALPETGEVITYTIDLYNDGPSTATGIEVTDALPSLVSFSAASGDGNYNTITNTWTVASLAAGETVTLELEVTVMAGPDDGPVANWAEVSAVDQEDVDSTPDPTGDPTNNAPEDDEDVAIFEVPAPMEIDLSLEKSVLFAEVETGEEITYTIVVTNDGPANATGVEVIDELPTGVVYNGDNGNGAYNPFTSKWTVGGILAGESATLEIYVIVTALAGSGQIANWAEISAADQPDVDSMPDPTGDPTNNTPEDDEDVAIIEVPAPMEIDLSLEKSVSFTEVETGQELTYTIVVSNDGPADATGVEVIDQLPSGVVYNGDDSNGAYSPFTSTWMVGSILAGESATLIIDVIVSAEAGSGPIANWAEISAADQPDVDSMPDPTGDPTNNTPEDDEDVAIIEVPAPMEIDLSLEKSVSFTEVETGQEIAYTIVVTNDGPADATGVEVIDQLPTGVVYNGDDSNGAYSPFTSTWMVGSILAGESATLIIDVIVSAEAGSGPISNWAEVSAADQPDVDSMPDPTGDPTNNTPEDDEDVAIIEVPAPILADVSLTKEVNAYEVATGDMVTYTVVVHNDGPGMATGINVIDVLPVGVVYNGDNSNGAFNPFTSTWSVGDLDLGQTAELQLYAVVSAVAGDGEITNWAEVSAMDQLDTDSEVDPTGDWTNNAGQDDEASAVIIVPEPVLIDLSVEKTVDQYMVETGQVVNYTITVNNDGPADATGVELIDAMPSGIQFNGDDAGGTFNPFTNTWMVGTVVAGGSRVLNLSAIVIAEAGDGEQWNHAEISAADQEDVDSTPDPLGDPTDNTDEDDEAGVPIIVPMPAQADVSLEKTVNAYEVATGDQITFTLTIHNDGPGDASGLTVIDAWPIGATYAGDDGAGAFNPFTNTWSVGELAAGESLVLHINAIVTAEAGDGEITNYAELSGMNEEDTDSEFDPTGNPINNTGEDDESSATFIVPEPIIVDLELLKMANAYEVATDDLVTFELLLNNQGPGNATGVTVIDQLPVGMLYEGDNGGGAYNPITGIWTVGDIDANATRTLQIYVSISATADDGEIWNYAEVATVDQEDIDSSPDPSGDPTNNSDEDDEAGAPIIVPAPQLIDLELTKTVSSYEVATDDLISYTISITNLGPAVATGVEVIENFPAGVSYSSDDSNGAFSPFTNIWNVGSLSVNETKELHINTLVLAEGGDGEQTNYTEVIAADQDDVDSKPDPTADPLNDDGEDDESSAVIIVPEPMTVALDLNKTANVPFAAQGDVIIYTISVANAGPATATGVEVIDYLPEDLVYAGHSGDGMYSPFSSTWYVEEIPAGVTVSFDLQAIVVGDEGEIINCAEVAAVDQEDENSTPDPSGDPFNNTGEADEHCATVPYSPADLSDISVEAVCLGMDPMQNDIISYTIYVTNDGPADATGVQLIDELPLGLAYIDDNSNGAYNPVNGVWNVGSLEVGELQQLTIEALVYGDPGLSIGFVAELIGLDQEDPDSSIDPIGNPFNNTGEDDEVECDLSIAFPPIPECPYVTTCPATGLCAAVGETIEICTQFCGVGLVSLESAVLNGAELDLASPACATYVVPAAASGEDVVFLEFKDEEGNCYEQEITLFYGDCDGPTCGSDAGQLSLDGLACDNEIINFGFSELPILAPGLEAMLIVSEGPLLQITAYYPYPWIDQLDAGDYNAHVFIYNPSVINMNEFSTVFQLYATLQIGGGPLCGDLNIPGYSFTVNDDCPDFPEPECENPTVCPAMEICASPGETITVCPDLCGDGLIILQTAMLGNQELNSVGNCAELTLPDNPTGNYVVTLTFSDSNGKCFVQERAIKTDGCQGPKCGNSAGVLAVPDQALCALEPVVFTFEEIGFTTDGFVSAVLVSQGPLLEIVGVSPTMATVVTAGDYFASVVVYDPTEMNPSNYDTAYDLYADLIIGGGEYCGDLQFPATPFTVESCAEECLADAGSLIANSGTYCEGDLISIGSTLAPQVPIGYEVEYCLINDGFFTIVGSSSVPQFIAPAVGEYSVHVVVYNPLEMNLSDFDTLLEIIAEFPSGGGDICGDLTLSGSSILVQECNEPIDCDDPIDCGSMAVCTEPITPITICPDVCFGPAPFSVVEAHSTFECSLVYLDSGCIIYTPLPGMESIGSDQVELTVLDGDNNCHTVHVDITIGCEDECEADAAFMQALDVDWCEGDFVQAITAGNPVVPFGFESTYMLVQNGNIVALGNAPLFQVNNAGAYQIYYVVFDTETLDMVLFSTINALQQVFNATCGDVSAPATIIVEECDEPCEYEDQFLCTGPIQPIIICPEFCEDDSVSLSAHSTYDCSLVDLGDCIRYTPLPGFQGTDEVTIEGCNAAGDCDVITYFIAIGNCTNLPPYAIEDVFQIEKGTEITIAPLANDMDPDGDDFGYCFTADDLMPANGTVTLIGNSIEYLPNPGFIGNETFTYTICDEFGNSATGEITISVVEVGCESQQILCAEPLEAILVCVDFCEENMVLETITTTFECGIDQAISNCFYYTALPTFNGLEYIIAEGCNFFGQCEQVNILIDVNDDCEQEDLVENADDKVIVADLPTPSLVVQLEDLLENTRDEEEQVLSELQIPNLISPNGDGINDLFSITGLESLPANTQLDLSVFDRFGQLIYREANYGTNGWWNFSDGLSVKAYPVGTYFYLIRLSNDEYDITRKGFVDIR
ncbi:gliding motility-associated C-terminal domain-containing protein [Chitinophagales bacterium]|nr:gliding motility-associated C-terminal domain-containing protein [Chitinophagales bacterium]